MSVADLLSILVWTALGIYGAVCAHAGFAIGATKKREGAGFWLGLLLGVVGLVVVHLMSEPTSVDYSRRDHAGPGMR